MILAFLSHVVHYFSEGVHIRVIGEKLEEFFQLRFCAASSLALASYDVRVLADESPFVFLRQLIDVASCFIARHDLAHECFVVLLALRARREFLRVTMLPLQV